MKFGQFREFSTFGAETLDKVLTFLKIELSANFKELSTGMKKLDFLHNFASFEAQVEIVAGQELSVQNQLSGIPRYKIIVRGNNASKDIVDGDTQWTNNYVTLKNGHATDTAIATVLFFK